MSLVSKLADLILEFSAKGAEAVQTTLTGLSQKLDATKLVGDAAGAALDSSMNKVTQSVTKAAVAVGALQSKIASLGNLQARLKTVADSLQTVADYAGAAFRTITGALGGFIAAGIATSNVGALISFQMGQLSRTIAGLFRPEIEAVLNGIRQLVNWLRSLSDAQRASLVHWIEATVVGLGLAMVLPKIVNGVILVVSAVRTLAIALGVLSGAITATGIGALIQVAAVALAGILALVVGTDTGRRALSEFGRSLKPLLESLAAMNEQLAKLAGSALERLAGILERISKITITPIIDAMTKLLELINKFNEWQDRHPFIKYLLSAGLSPLSGSGSGSSDKANRSALAPSTGGWDSSADAPWWRIAQESVKAQSGKGVDEQQLDELRDIKKEQQETNRQLAKQQPAFAR